jgi:cytochrome P450
MRGQYPPGPRDGLLGITLHGRFQSRPLEFVEEVARRYGDLAFVRLAWVRLYLVNRPELIREVLVSRLKSFQKIPRQTRALRKIEGNGLVVAEGEAWKRHRPVVQTAFHARFLACYANAVVDYARRRSDRWTPGVTFNLAEEMNQLALEIIAKVIFDVDWSDRAARLRDAVHVFREYMQKEISRPIMLPDWVPLPGRLRQRRAARAVDELLCALIRERRASGHDRPDMLSLMLSAAERVTGGPPVSDLQIRDEVATLFLAGHDTTSAALAWLWYLLARHPEVERRVVEEVDAALGQRPATYEDLTRLRYTEMAVRESMRLYPAAGFLYGRQATEDVHLAGYTLRRGSWVFISPYVVHRDAKYFKDPEVFDPERFAPGRVAEIPPYAYLPFGGGPRTCIGNGFAMMEIILAAATILQTFRLVLDQGEATAQMEIVLRPKGGLRMRALRRETKGAGAEVASAGGVRRA